jgi:hypothetical protein
MHAASGCENGLTQLEGSAPTKNGTYFRTNPKELSENNFRESRAMTSIAPTKKTCPVGANLVFALWEKLFSHSQIGKLFLDKS